MSGENIKEYCGVFGIYNHPEAASLTHLGLFSLQHRGEESAGICTSDGRDLLIHKGMGLVGEIFDQDILEKLRGIHAIGHTRYSTTGSSSLINAQPYRVDYSRGQVAIAHNGNLVNAQSLRAELEAYGSIFGSTTDSELFIHLMAKPSYRNAEEAVIDAVTKGLGAFSIVILAENQLFAARDPQGFRPLCLGKIDDGYVVASETCAFDLIGAEYVRDVEPGEVVIIDHEGVRSHFPFGDQVKPAHCIFEHVYFSRPDSRVFGDNVALVREQMGRYLAKENPVEADIVCPVPDSGNFAAMGYAKESGIPLAHGFTRNHYIGRTFINPTQEARTTKVRIKLNPIREVVQGKRVIVVDDSIVRGNTAKSRVALLRKAGATEVHMRISCPPHVSPCYYGIDFPSKDELVACKYSLEELKDFLGVDSLGYLSIEGMLNSTTKDNSHFCSACFSGKYPTLIPDDVDKFKLEKKKC